MSVEVEVVAGDPHEIRHVVGHDAAGRIVFEVQSVNRATGVIAGSRAKVMHDFEVRRLIAMLEAALERGEPE